MDKLKDREAEQENRKWNTIERNLNKFPKKMLVGMVTANMCDIETMQRMSLDEFIKHWKRIHKFNEIAVKAFSNPKLKLVKEKT